MESTAQAAPGAAPVSVPATLQASLLARLERMPDAKQVAQIGAVFGREFSYAMIRVVADLPDSVLNSGLDQLVNSGLMFRRGETRDASYTFKHALVQDAAYDSLLRVRRVALHAAIGAALEQDAEIVAMRPSLLGHHFAEAGAVEKATAYLLRAGEQASAGSALAEAETHLTRGLTLAADIAEASSRNLRLAELTLALSNVHMTVHGFGSPENGAAAAEAVGLCRGLGPEHGAKTKLLARALLGQWTFGIYRGRVMASYAVAEELLAFGREHTDPQIRTIAATLHGTSCCLLGRLQEGARTFAAGVADLGLESHAAPMVDFGVDGPCLLLIQSARLLACHGFLNTAGKQQRVGMERATRLQHLPTISVTLGTSCTMAWILRDLGLLRSWSAEMARVAQEQGYGYWLARSKGYIGWLAAIDGRLDEGRALLTEELTELAAIGIVLFVPYTKAMLADVHARMGQCERALAVLNEALDTCNDTGEVWAEAELHRQKGELLRADPDTAETCFRRAIEIASAQSAKLFELRASVSLARLWGEHGKRDEAHALLAPIHAWFTEGFDTPDLTDAKALLDEFAASPA